MSEIKKRKSHTAEFKARVGLEAIRSKKRLMKQVNNMACIPCRLVSGRKRYRSNQKPCLKENEVPSH